MMKASGLLISAAIAVGVAAGQAPAINPVNVQPVAIQVNLAKPLGSYKPITNWFGYDESNYTTMPYGEQLLSELHALSAAPVTIRTHHLLTSGNGVPELKWSSSNVFSLDANGKPVYDFTITDQTFDEFANAGVRPMVELGFMPKDLAATVPGISAYQLHYPAHTMGGASNNPPKDYKMWGELVRRYTVHLVERYGRARVSTWYFEVWNEPDIDYWHGTPAEYFKLYDYAVAGVRAALPGAKVGGPASTGPASARASAFLESFLEHCLHDKSAADGKPVPLDFISFHPKGSPSMVDGHVRMGLSRELQAAEAGFQIVARHPEFLHLPIILSEADPEGCAACSAKENPANTYRNGALYAAYTATAVKALFNLEDKNHVNLTAMLSWSFEFEKEGYFEGYRTLATHGIDKPILNLFRMMGMMAGERAMTTSTAEVPLEELVKTGVRQAPDVDALATKSEHEAAVMVWNYHDDDLAAPDAEVQVTFKGIPAGVKKVQLEHYRIDETHSNAFTAWKKMGSPRTPTAEQTAQLKAAGQLQLLGSPEWLDVADGKVTIATAVPRQAVSLLRLEW
ncbi:MAG: beta-xylosidase [Terracidiphilus sp.]|jgi:xylan 1,4-beta-xylosidase